MNHPVTLDDDENLRHCYYSRTGIITLFELGRTGTIRELIQNGGLLLFEFIRYVCFILNGIVYSKNGVNRKRNARC